MSATCILCDSSRISCKRKVYYQKRVPALDFLVIFTVRNSSWEKVYVFTGVCLSTGGGEVYIPWADSPCSLGRHPSGLTPLGWHPPGQTPPLGRPPGQTPSRQTPPNRQPLQRMVSILLECILVSWIKPMKLTNIGGGWVRAWYLILLECSSWQLQINLNLIPRCDCLQWELIPYKFGTGTKIKIWWPSRKCFLCYHKSRCFFINIYHHY